MDENQESQPYLDKSSSQECLHKGASKWAATPAPADQFRGARRRDAAEATLQRLGYEWRGGELWAPPIGKAPEWTATPSPAEPEAKPFPGRIFGGPTLGDRLRAQEAQEIASKFDTSAALEQARKDRAAMPAPAPDAPLRDAQEQPFEDWWEREGQFCRAGGSSYEKTFAWNAWCAALAATPAPVPVAEVDDGEPNRIRWLHDFDKRPADGVKLYTPTVAATPAPAPQGWKLVPIEPTPEMLRAEPPEGFEMSFQRRPEVWAAMLAAAPEAATPAPGPMTDQAKRAIGSWLNAAMAQAVEAGANSISMPDEYVEIAAWLAGQGKEASK